MEQSFYVEERFLLPFFAEISLTFGGKCSTFLYTVLCFFVHSLHFISPSNFHLKYTKKYRLPGEEEEKMLPDNSKLSMRMRELEKDI